MRTKRTWAIALGLIPLAVACGGDDDASDASDPAANTSPADDTNSGDTATDATASTDTGGASSETAMPDGGDGGCTATVPGSELNFGVWAPTYQIDPTLTSGGLVGGHEIAAVYDVLFRFDFEADEYVPHLAKSMEPNDDFTVWTLELRKGITYSDGTPLTAQIVSDNLDRFFAEHPTNTSAGFLAPIKKKEVVDDLTLKFTLEGPWVEFPFVFSDEPGMVVNPNAIGDDLEKFAAKPPDAAGLGPYVVERNAPGEELVMKARDDYWGGPVCIETLRFRVIPGAQATYDAFNNDELDAAFLRDPNIIEQVREAGTDAFWVQQDSGLVMLLNHAENSPTSDPRIREAISLAIDEQLISDRAYQGALKTGKSLIQEDSRFYSDAIETMDTDPERAKQLVEEAKADGFDGKLEVLCKSDNPVEVDIGLTVEGLLNAVGFEVTNKVLPTTEQIGTVAQGEFDVACWGFNAGPDTGITTVMRVLRSDSEANRQGSKSAAVDTAIDDLMAAETPEAQQQAMADLNNAYVDEFVSTSVGAVEEGIVWHPDVHGILPTTSTIMLFHDAYLTEG